MVVSLKLVINTTVGFPSMRPKLDFLMRETSGSVPKQLEVGRAIIAGWTARDSIAMQEHIDELAELGVKPPVRTPIFYRVSARRLMTGSIIEAVGGASSGEVEFCLVNIDGEIWVGAGSDHTDRAAEAHGVTLSKQMCDKPLGSELWRLTDVAGHWDQLRLTAWIIENGDRVIYQDGPVTTMLAPEDLMAQFAAEDSAGGMQPGDLMMCGTLPATGGVRPSSRFEFELADPVLGRRISHAYDIVELPDWG
jgi:hypothetical protein